MFRSFSGWLSDIITAGPSLLVFYSLIPLPRPSFQSASPVSFRAPSLSRFLSSPLYFVSRHCPFQSPWDCGANTARYRINFLSRGCRDFTLLERRHWGGPAQSETFAALGAWYLGGLVSRVCRGEGEIKPRRKLKRGTEGS